MKKCQVCGKENYPGRGVRYCSRECYYKNEKDRLEHKNSEKAPLGTEAIDVDHPGLLNLERKLIAAKDEVRDLKKKLMAAQRDQILFTSLAEVVRETQVPLDPVQLDPQPRRGGIPVDAVVLLSDEHGDQVISAAGTWGLEEYSFDIFRCRLQRWTQQIVNHCLEYLSNYSVERLWVFKLGDSVHGDIHSPVTTFSNTIKAALAVGDAEAQALQSLIPHFPGGVHVVSVPGNHPRRSKRMDWDHPHNNFDYLVSTQIATRLSRDREAGNCTVYAPASYTAFVDVRGHIWALNHGTSVKGWAGFPFYGFSKRNNRVQALVSTKNIKVSYFAYGHFHTAAAIQDMAGESIHAGNWTLTDPYAAEAIAVGSTPIQQLFLVEEHYGKILEVPIYVRDLEAEERFKAGEWEPDIGRSNIMDEVTPSSPLSDSWQVIQATAG